MLGKISIFAWRTLPVLGGCRLLNFAAMEKILCDIIADISATKIIGDNTTVISHLTLDSREVSRGSLFFAVKGESVDGHSFIAKAVEAGASAVVCEALPEQPLDGVTYILVDDSAEAVGMVSSAFYGYPSRELSLVGVTGTNGKTTTATLLYDLFKMNGTKCGLISTVIYRIGEESMPSTHTTPDGITINRMLSQMVEQGCSHCFMEVSSHSLVQRRVAGLEFDAALFTNITHDHLDYHKSFPEYIKAKRLLFDTLPKSSYAIYNGDDRNGEIMVQNSKAKRVSFSLSSVSDYKCRIIERHLDGMLLEIDSSEVWVGLIGDFNAHNLLGVYVVARLLGMDKEEVLQRISMLRSVVGRFQYVVSEDGKVAIVDYAHTPDALKNVLETIAQIRRDDSRIITVVGCGGDRDKTKRPVMAKLALDMSDFVMLTSDNPRTESPEAILKDMEAGLKDMASASGRYVIISDREQAIRMAVAYAKGGDVILVAGKGHENYQEIDGKRHHFDDMEQVRAALNLDNR